MSVSRLQLQIFGFKLDKMTALRCLLSKAPSNWGDKALHCQYLIILRGWIQWFALKLLKMTNKVITIYFQKKDHVFNDLMFLVFCFHLLPLSPSLSLSCEPQGGKESAMTCLINKMLYPPLASTPWVPWLDFHLVSILNRSPIHPLIRDPYFISVQTFNPSI